MDIRLGKNPARHLTKDMVLFQMKVYFALLELKDQFGLDFLGVQDGYEPIYKYDKSWYDQNFFVRGVPWLANFGEEDFSWSERTKDAGKLIDGIRKIAKKEPLRPLFLALHLPITHGYHYDHVVEIQKALNPKQFKIVRPDEFMLLCRNAKQEGRISPREF